MKSSGRGNRPWNKLTNMSSMAGLKHSTHCLWSENGPRCKKWFDVLPYHKGNRRLFCAEHREILAEREAEEWIKRDPKMAKYVNKELLLNA